MQGAGEGGGVSERGQVELNLAAINTLPHLTHTLSQNEMAAVVPQIVGIRVCSNVLQL